MSNITLHLATYIMKTNTISGYLFPKPDIDCAGFYEDELVEWQNSKIEATVDDELKSFIKKWIDGLDNEIDPYFDTDYIQDITPIMDRIEITHEFSSVGDIYTAKLKQVEYNNEFVKNTPEHRTKQLNDWSNLMCEPIEQVDKIEVNEAILFAEWIKDEKLWKTININKSQYDRINQILKEE